MISNKDGFVKSKGYGAIICYKKVSSKADLVSQYSEQDHATHLKYLRRKNNSRVTGEISGKTQKLLDKLNVHITCT